MNSTHEWFVAQFSYASWTECTCGYKPASQADMDAHGWQGSPS